MQHNAIINNTASLLSCNNFATISVIQFP